MAENEKECKVMDEGRHTIRHPPPLNRNQNLPPYPEALDCVRDSVLPTDPADGTLFPDDDAARFGPDDLILVGAAAAWTRTQLGIHKWMDAHINASLTHSLRAKMRILSLSLSLCEASLSLSLSLSLCEASLSLSDFFCL